MNDAGHISVDLRDTVFVASTRPYNVGRVFVGKTPDEVCRLLPLVFAVCGEAQSVAGQLAMGIAPPVHAGRVVASEALREHFMRIALGWGQVIGCEPENALLKRIHGLVKLAKADAVAVVGEANMLLETLVARAEDINSGLAWVSAHETIAARMLRLVESRGWAALGATGMSGQPFGAETSAFRMMMSHPVMQKLVVDNGDGIHARLVARVLHCARLVDLVRNPTSFDTPAKSGEAEVETSRGILRHRVVVQNGIVVSYDVIAPTDGNFAPDGPAMAGLVALRNQCAGEIETPARLMVEAFDPCVAYSLMVS